MPQLVLLLKMALQTKGKVRRGQPGWCREGDQKYWLERGRRGGRRDAQKGGTGEPLGRGRRVGGRDFLLDAQRPFFIPLFNSNSLSAHSEPSAHPHGAHIQIGKTEEKPSQMWQG